MPSIAARAPWRWMPLSTGLHRRGSQDHAEVGAGPAGGVVELLGHELQGGRGVHLLVAWEAWQANVGPTWPLFGSLVLFVHDLCLDDL